MIIIRPIKMSDYDDLYFIAKESGHGFTSLPLNEKVLKKRILHSELAFKTDVKQPGNERYLFVMEDTNANQVVGTTAIDAAVGLDDSFYHFHINKDVDGSQEFNVQNTVETLSLCKDYTGASEICTIFLQKSHRKFNNGKFLSRCRFLFMAEHQQRFDNRVIAEMRGVCDEHGKSPFYSWLEEHFLSISFTEADYLKGIGESDFIDELMPKHPINISRLSKEAQRAINNVNRKSFAALRLLEMEGFSRRGYIDIFDAGPTIEADKNNIRTVRESKKYSVLICNENKPLSKQKYFVCNTKVESFRAIQVNVTLREITKQVIISSEVAKALHVIKGEFVRLICN